MRSNKSSYLSIILMSLMIVSCQITDENVPEEIVDSRANLGDLAKKSSRKKLTIKPLTAEQRSARLVEIYQSILALQPNPEVQKQMEYRLVQLDIEAFEKQQYSTDEALDNADSRDDASNTDTDASTDLALKNESEALARLITQYQGLIKKYPNSENNEFMQYQLSKAYDLQGDQDASLLAMEALLQQFPESKYALELNFRRGDIYYSQGDYQAALGAYAAVSNEKQDNKYYLHSLYMKGWTQFKLNKLTEGDLTFIQVLNELADEVEQIPASYRQPFSFDYLPDSKKNLVADALRVLSISLSQQRQSDSLVELVNTGKKQEINVVRYQHVLFDNLAKFLISKDLYVDAEKTYQNYIGLNTVDIWSARYHIELMNLYKRRGDYPAIRELKAEYVLLFGLDSPVWQDATAEEIKDVLPNLLNFSHQHARRVYADAQKSALKQKTAKFKDAAIWLSRYLDFTEQQGADALLANSPVIETFLYADASYAALDYEIALACYEKLGYIMPIAPPTEADIAASKSIGINFKDIPIEAAYSTTITARKMLSLVDENNDEYARLVDSRDFFDKRFVDQYPNDTRSHVIAVNAAQTAFNNKNDGRALYYADYLLNELIILKRNQQGEPIAYKPRTKLSKKELNQVQTATQIKANIAYQLEDYPQAEIAYTLAGTYVKPKSTKAREIRDLVGSSIYLHAQALKAKGDIVAVDELLRLGKVIPESKYRVTAEFDAANLLMDAEKWHQAIDVLNTFKKRYPKHEYSKSIPAKLAFAYEQSEQWELAAVQLTQILAKEKNPELKREAQYTAAEFYLKAGNVSKAIVSFRAYAHAYPQPFDIAQEVRLKMTEFYRQTKEPNKMHFWHRKIVTSHTKQAHKEAPDVQQRSAFLASQSAYELGMAHQQTFKHVKLKAPLNKTLKKKQAAMKQAIRYFQTVLNLALADFVPKATFQLAEMYRQLAADVMGSQRPKDLDELALEEYEILLEELAYPFEEKAIDIHKVNAERSWQGIYDEWIQASFTKLATLEPAHYNKSEVSHHAIEAIH